MFLRLAKTGHLNPIFGGMARLVRNDDRAIIYRQNAGTRIAGSILIFIGVGIALLGIRDLSSLSAGIRSEHLDVLGALIIGPLAALFGLYLTGPNDLRIDLRARTWRRRQGFPLFARWTEGTFEEFHYLTLQKQLGRGAVWRVLLHFHGERAEKFTLEEVMEEDSLSGADPRSQALDRMEEFARKLGLPAYDQTITRRYTPAPTPANASPPAPLASKQTDRFRMDVQGGRLRLSKLWYPALKDNRDIHGLVTQVILALVFAGFLLVFFFMLRGYMWETLQRWARPDLLAYILKDRSELLRLLPFAVMVIPAWMVLQGILGLLGTARAVMRETTPVTLDADADQVFHGGRPLARVKDIRSLDIRHYQWQVSSGDSWRLITRCSLYLIFADETRLELDDTEDERGLYALAEDVARFLGVETIVT
jgi:hypothetical protein